MVSLFIFTSSLNRKLVLRNCSYVSPFIFLANVWVEVKTSCQNLFRVSLRSFKRNSGPHCKVRSKRGKSCMSINLHVALLHWIMFSITEIFYIMIHFTAMCTCSRLGVPMRCVRTSYVQHKPSFVLVLRSLVPVFTSQL